MAPRCRNVWKFHTYHELYFMNYVLLNVYVQSSFDVLIVCRILCLAILSKFVWIHERQESFACNTYVYSKFSVNALKILNRQWGS